MNPDQHDPAIINTVKQKFRVCGTILAIFQGYQIDGDRRKNRLLVIVRSESSSALFTFSVVRYPPESVSDLTVVSAYPINASFWVNPVSCLHSRQFTIFSNNEPIVYYYEDSPDAIASRDNFIGKLKLEITEYMCNSTQTSVTGGSIDFEWVDEFKRAEMLSLNQNITDGSQAKPRNFHFEEELQKRRNEYIVFKQFKIYTGTWNVNGQLAEDIDLKEWLSTTEDPPDIYAVGLQEIEFSAEKVILNETKIDRTWVNKIMSGLHSGAKYKELTSVRLVGMMLTVAVKAPLKDHISDFWTAAVPTGLINRGNKGGVGVSFQLNESLLCFVNVHLAAHTQEVERRNEDHDEIIQSMFFGNTMEGRFIDDHHHIFWIGDLNYRLNGDMTQAFVSEKNNDYNQLFPFDQLYLEKFREKIFQNYNEGKITFAPTYKYDPGTDNWDSSEKKRSPAWCDRILWKGSQIDLLKYDSVMQLRKSDHKPVFAVFNVNIETKDDEKLKKVRIELLKTYDEYENDNQPQLIVRQTELNFGYIRFNEKFSRELIITNNGHVPLKFKFAVKDERLNKVCEEFIQISHESGELPTGNSLSIWIDVFVGAKTISYMLQKLKNADKKMKSRLDILVLRVENGRDTFITIYGEYILSCFGVSLETLLKLNKPICEYEINELITLEKKEVQHNLSVDHIPREIWRLVNYLNNSDVESVKLFTLNQPHSNHEKFPEIRDWLDSWSSEAFPGGPRSAAEALLLFLESLPQPVVDISVQDCKVCEDDYAKCRELIRTKLKPVNRQVFLYICKFLKELRKRGCLVRLEELATIFGKVLIRSTQPTEAGTTAGKEMCSYTEGVRDMRQKFMMAFLKNEGFRFGWSNKFGISKT
ncbi:inositol polyphosphate 5-phosphatase OCRL-like [Uranotaenia lowii]|uniref:inositol polyphosphate 5-phosphatase OCRL-like n=1 Tax=Uranotaenia lowii TaxID=190385 RepID=UPI0024798FC5|nr:inositol polyphosphate 5-phosphatase OCRL-like [Uranotaenia lowii]